MDMMMKYPKVSSYECLVSSGTWIEAAADAGADMLAFVQHKIQGIGPRGVETRAR